MAELHESLRAAGIELCFAEMKDPVKDKLKRFGLFARFGQETFFPTVEAAVSSYLMSRPDEQSARDIGWRLNLTRMKMLDWLVGYRKDWLRPDIIAGLITAAVVIPKAMAYATVAGLPVQAGLYTAFVPMLIYAVLGSSRVLSVSTTTTIAILTGANLALVVPNGDPALLLRAAASLTLMVGVLLVVASILRVGFLANFISEPVLSGFKAGIGVVIVLDQVPKLLGVHFPKGSFLQNLLALFQSLPGTSAATLAVGLVMMALLLGLKRFVPRVPAPLVTVGAGIAATSLLGLEAYGVETVGEIQRGLPALTLPDFSLIAQLWPGALGIALMSFTETMAAGRAFAQSGEPALRPNQELLATGIATAGGAVLGGMPAGGGTSQTAVNRLAGARSQLAGLVTGGVTLLTLLFLAPLISLMPQATLAAVVIVYSVGLIQLPEFRAILAVRRTEFIWAVAAFAGVMLLGYSQGHPRRHHHFPGVSRAAGGRPAGVPAGPQAGYERVPPALGRASRRRDL